MSPALEEPANVPLDEVMLAMDIVDTLRHQRAQVESELNEEARERQLIARVKSIYSSQGMEVPEEVIAKGVKALVEDRFVYDPPARTFAVRLAELYVERGKWALRLLIVLLLVGATWAAFAIPAHLRRQESIATFRATIASLDGTAEQLERRVESLRRLVANARDPEGPAAVTAILEEADKILNDADASLSRQRTAIDPGPAPEIYPENQARLDREVQGHREVFADVERNLGIAAGKVESVRRLGSLRTKANLALSGLAGVEVTEDVREELVAQQKAILLAVNSGDADRAEGQLAELTRRVKTLVQTHAARRARTAELVRLRNRLVGIELDAAAQRELASLTTSVEQAIASNDDGTAARDLQKLSALVALLDSSYELRIVTRGDRSGVWRYDRGRRGGKRNYYIIVEAISPKGRRIRMPIANEETDRTSVVTRWGVRVPEQVFESVKRDKTDNGIIDNRIFGTKRRGSKTIDYRFPVVGGMITRWDN